MKIYMSVYDLQVYETNEELVQNFEADADQAKLLLEVQKENRELRVQLARQQQKLLNLQAQSLAANASPIPASVSPILTPPPSSNKQRPKTPLQTTPEPNKRRGADDSVRELQMVVKTLEAEIVRVKKDHALQMKKKDDKIRELTAKLSKGLRPRDEGLKSIVTRSNLRTKEAHTGDIKTPGHRFLSPAPAAKKRSFWDITTANSPSVTTVNGRKTRSHVNAEPGGQPSMLLQVIDIQIF